MCDLSAQQIPGRGCEGRGRTLWSKLMDIEPSARRDGQIVWILGSLVGWSAVEVVRPEWLRRPLRHILLRAAPAYGS